MRRAELFDSPGTIPRLGRPSFTSRINLSRIIPSNRTGASRRACTGVRARGAENSDLRWREQKELDRKSASFYLLHVMRSNLLADLP